MSDRDRQNNENVKQESMQLLGLWALTMVVAIGLISSLSTRSTDGAKAPAGAAPAAAVQATAPPLDAAQTLAPLPAGHPSIEALLTEEAAVMSELELPEGHPPLDAAPAPAAVQTETGGSGR